MSKTTAVAKLTSKVESDDQVALTFNADYNDERNKAWAKYTPSLSITMYVTPEVADSQFEQGGRYLLTFEKQ